MKVEILHGDCIQRLATFKDSSLDAVISDPPYGLEFMGKDWDAPWKYTFSKHGFSDGGNRVAAPSFNSNRNPTCQTCGKRKRTWKGGPLACSCASPKFDRDKEVQDRQLFGAWCSLWLTECYRSLKAGGVLKVFGGTRMFHRLGVAVEKAGFEGLRLEPYLYGSGFPKSLDVSKALIKKGEDGAEQWSGWGTALKPAWEPVVVGYKPR